MPKKVLILYVPVIHKGYLDFFDRLKSKGGSRSSATPPKGRGNVAKRAELSLPPKVSEIYLIDEKLQKELSEFKPDIASLPAKKVKELFINLGFKSISVLSKSGLGKVRGKEIILVDDEICRNLAANYLKKARIKWEKVFLRWHKSKILQEVPPKDIAVSKSAFDRKMMAEAREESEKSSDWWRQIGAVLVKNKKIILRGNNKSLPADYTPYQVGEARDFFKAGERQDISNTIHAEQMILAEAAKKGISTKDLSLYATCFPCPLCAKLIAFSGINKLYFQSGGSNFDAKKVLESAGVKITLVQ